ncbi:MAG: TatD family hydrolase [Verrucomicrobia bacterium]|nr:TatD family hydrolase [Verrucomicrobiota bacterium]
MDLRVATRWSDCHNHLHLQGDAEMLGGLLESMGSVRCVVNATREDDWDRIAAMAAACPERVAAAYGIHPWHAGTVSDGWQERLRERLAADPRATVGECGLDGSVKVDRELQRRIFKDHLRIAREMDRVVTVHCVRAWGGVMDALTDSPPRRFLMHGYAGSAEMAARFATLGGWFSANGRIAKMGKLGVFRSIPLDRVVLESDYGAAAGADCPRLGDVAAALAVALGCGENEMAERVEANASVLFRESFATWTGYEI